VNVEPLRTLLRRAFAPAELRRVLAAFPAGDEALPARLLDATADADALVDEILAAIDRGPHGAGLLVHLAAVRPDLAGELGETAAQIGAPEAFTVASLLSAGQDAAAERKLTEIERARPATSSDRHELNLAVADLHRWQREAGERAEPSGSRRDAITRRLTSVAASMSARASQSGEIDELAATAHPEAARLREEIEAHVRRADGKRAALRLLDLAERFADRAVRRRAIELAARAGTWRSRHVPGVRLEVGEQREWTALLQAILGLTDDIVHGAAASPGEAADERWLTASQGAAAREALQAAADLEFAPLVRCASLSLRYRRSGPLVLKDVSLTVFPRSVVGVVGANGAGKTSLLRVLAGERRVDAGMIAYPQLDPAPPERGEIDWPAVRSQIAHVPQRLPEWRGRLAEHLHAWAGACGLHGDENVDIVEFWLERVGLTNRRSARWSELSRSLQTRVALARALVGRPRLLLIDEPLVALDPRAQQWFLQDLHDIVSSSSLHVAAVVSSQHIPELEAIADDVVGLRDDGGVWFHGAVLELEQSRRGALFEIGGRLDDATCDRLTARFGPGCLRQRESVTLLRVGRDVSRGAVLELLSAGGEPPLYFRDISASHLRMFWGDRP